MRKSIHFAVVVLALMLKNAPDPFLGPKEKRRGTRQAQKSQRTPREDQQKNVRKSQNRKAK